MREHEDRYSLDLLGLQRAFERRHDATASFDDRLMYRCAVGAPEIEIRACQVCRADRVVSGSIDAVAVKAIALGAVLKQHLAAGGSGRVRLLTADLEDIFDYVLDFLRRQEFLAAEFLRILLGAIFWIVSEHVGFQPARVRIV